MSKPIDLTYYFERDINEKHERDCSTFASIQRTTADKTDFQDMG